jgi:3-hydroxyisobutyrate dehydrogenase-like beta-hydroxyacid dehydrogenase
MSKSIGVIGLGIIGSVWARHYETAGVLAGAWNRSPQPDFPRWLPGPAAVARASDVIQIVIADPPAVDAVLAAILPELGANKFVIQSSTIDPDSSERFCRLVTATGARYLEAPFVGSKSAAEARKNNFYLGGSAELAAEAEPLLALVSERRFHIGTGRQAATLKLAINLNVALQMAALGESLALARRAGIGDDTYFSVLEKNISCSPLVKLKEANLRSGDFPPQFSIKHMSKDMRLARGAAGAQALPQLNAVCEQLRRAEAAGWGSEDFSAMVKLASAGQ